LVGKGAFVVLFDILPNDKGADVAKAFGDQCLYVQTDITESDSVKQALDQALSHFKSKLEAQGGKLVGGVHCAGIAIKKEWTNNMVDSIPNFEKMLKVNVSAPPPIQRVRELIPPSLLDHRYIHHQCPHRRRYQRAVPHQGGRAILRHRRGTWHHRQLCFCRRT
jgi:NAD(P)-dependent dehydrogenase (short-subunit alcohol dehydrogenase family)